MNPQPADNPVDRSRFPAPVLLTRHQPLIRRGGHPQSQRPCPQDDPTADTHTDLREHRFSPASTVVMTVSVLIDSISTVEQAADEETCVHPPVPALGASRHRVPHTNPVGGPR